MFDYITALDADPPIPSNITYINCLYRKAVIWSSIRQLSILIFAIIKIDRYYIMIIFKIIPGKLDTYKIHIIMLIKLSKMVQFTYSRFLVCIFVWHKRWVQINEHIRSSSLRQNHWNIKERRWWWSIRGVERLSRLAQKKRCTPPPHFVAFRIISFWINRDCTWYVQLNLNAV